jgi:hypothetical protein
MVTGGGRSAGASQVSVIASILTDTPARHERELRPGRKTAFQARETRVFAPG